MKTRCCCSKRYLLVFSILLVSVGSIFMSVSLSSCSSPSVKNPLLLQSPNQKIPDRKTKCVIETHLNIKQNVIFGANLKPV